MSTPSTSRGKPKKSGPLPALAEPIRAVVLGIEPGSRSGWAILTPDGLQSAGATKTDHAGVVLRAKSIADHLALPLVVAAEKWSLGGRMRGDGHGRINMLVGLNVSWGMWQQAIRAAEVPLARIVRVTSMRWRARVIGGRQRPTEDWKRDAIAAMRTRYEGIELGSDAAEAACIATWASTAQEAADCVPKPRAKSATPKRSSKRSSKKSTTAGSAQSPAVPTQPSLWDEAGAHG